LPVHVENRAANGNFQDGRGGRRTHGVILIVLRCAMVRGAKVRPKVREWRG